MMPETVAMVRDAMVGRIQAARGRVDELASGLWTGPKRDADRLDSGLGSLLDVGIEARSVGQESQSLSRVPVARDGADDVYEDIQRGLSHVSEGKNVERDAGRLIDAVVTRSLGQAADVATRQADLGGTLARLREEMDSAITHLEGLELPTRW